MRRSIRLDKEYIVHSYLTEDELAIKEFLAFNEVDDDDLEPFVDELLQKFVEEYDPEMDKIKKIVLLWCIRILTLGDEIEVNFKCKKCGNVQDTTISLANLLRFPEIDSDEVPTKFVDSSEPIEISDEFYDEMDIDDFEFYAKNLYSYYIVYNTKIHFNCYYCNEDHFTNLMSFKKVLQFMSEDSYETLTEWLHVLVYFGHLTRNDVLKMTPVQRMLEIKYFQETKKKELGDQNGN